jgi:hypothetical protein
MRERVKRGSCRTRLAIPRQHEPLLEVVAPDEPASRPLPQGIQKCLTPTEGEEQQVDHPERPVVRAEGRPPRSVLEDRDLACAELCSIALPELVSMNPLVGAERHAAPGRRTLT